MTTTTRRTIAVTVVALVGAVLTPASSTAAPTWLPAQQISNASTNVGDLEIASDAAGNSVAVWSRIEDARQRIEAASRPAGGTWSAPVVLDYGDSVSVATDGAGVATAVWDTDSYVAGVEVVRAARLPSPAGVWTAPRAISELDVDSIEPSVAANAAGDTVVAWQTISTTPWEVHAAFRPAGGGWQAPVPVSDTSVDAELPDVVLDDAGTATAAWSLDDDIDVVQASMRPPGGSWSEPVAVSDPADDSNDLQLAGGPAGTVTAVWEADVGVDEIPGIQSSLFSGGTWSAPVTISDGPDRYEPTIAVNGSGQAVAGWDDEANVAGAQVARRAPDGTWGPAIRLDDAVPADRAVVAIDGHGVATAVWRDEDGTRSLRASRQVPGGAWSSPVEIPGSQSPSESYAASHADADGDVVLAWVSSLFPETHVRAAGLDAAGPHLSAFAAPSAAGVGQWLNFSAEASDNWSSVASYSWAFGDGTTASGPWVTHAYAAAGTYAATLTVTDTLGNATTRTTPVTVTATASVPAPVPLAAPELTRFKLADPKIKAFSRAASVATKTKLKIGLTTTAQVRLVVRSKHRHLVGGEMRFVKVTLTRSRPTGRSAITIRNRLATIKLPADTYRIVGTATNKAGTSPKKTVKLVVEPRGGA